MSAHSRKPSTRAALPRRTTRGPLDGDDPLSPSSPAGTPAPQPLSSSAVSQVKTADAESKSEAQLPIETTVNNDAEAEEKDLSFLLDASIYHPLSQLEIPAPFRRPFPQLNAALADVTRAFQEIDAALSRCDYVGAAYLSGGLLSAGLLKATDQHHIFRALHIRYSCLELSGNVLLAAQEAKALEDLGSAFYYIGLPEDEAVSEQIADRPLPRHIMPFGLRLQALRLQSIGFSDPRRGVASLYDLGMECREHIASPATSDELRQLWVQRLEDVGIRVVNALIEMGDLDCARRTLETMKPSDRGPASIWTCRKIMLCLRMGLVAEAQRLVDAPEFKQSEAHILQSLIAIADDRLDDAVTMLTTKAQEGDTELMALAKQNAAVALLYKGEIQKARSLLETLIEGHESFSTLTVNLTTIHDLTSEQSRDLKLAIASKIAADPRLRQARAFTNADFKL